MNRVAFTIFGIDIMWYGLLIGCGFLIAVYLSLKECRRIGFKEETLIDLMLVIVPVGIICARLYYVAFEWEQYSDNLIQILNFRAGGLAIHGGIIGGAIAALIFCKVKKISFLQVADIIAPAVVLAQGIGRWGNYTNGEAHGGPTDLPWGIMIDGVKVHPTFLYESIGDVLIFLFLCWYRKNKRKDDGEVVALYFILYSILRFFVEGFRTDSLMFFGLRTAQMVSILLIITGIAIFAYARNKDKHNQERI